MSNNDWYRYHVPRRLAAMTPAQIAADRTVAERDIAAVLTHCALHPTDRILEVGCGWGRHSIALAQAGFRRLISIDLVREPLRLAARMAAGAQCACTFRRQDFLHVQDGPYQAVVSLYDRSVCGFPSTSEDWHSLHHLAALLAPGGWLVFGINDWPLRLPTARRQWHITRSGLVLKEVLPNPVTMTCTDRLTLLRLNGQHACYTLTRRHYNLPELQDLLRASGFSVLAIQHRLDGGPYGTGEDGLFVYARKVPPLHIGWLPPAP